MVAYALEQVEFLSTPSARRATYSMDKNKMSMMISIHALCEEGDLLHAVDKLRLLVISIHALCEEGDARAASIAVRASGFLSTPSARRATPPWCVPCSQRCISIHALCEEGDDAGINTERLSWIFLSTPSARRATGRACCFQPASSYFYPRPLRGGRHSGMRSGALNRSNFYPRPLRGGRLKRRSSNFPKYKFLSTPSARRATTPS